MARDVLGLLPASILLPVKKWAAGGQGLGMRGAKSDCNSCYDWAILEQTRSSKNRFKVRRFDRVGLHQLQYNLRGRHVLPSLCFYCYVSAQELPSHTFAVAMSFYQISNSCSLHDSLQPHP